MDAFLEKNIICIESEVQNQTRVVINNVLTFLTELKDPQKLSEINFFKPRELAAKICGVSLRTVDRIRKERKTGELMCPRDIQARPVTGLSESDKDVIRRIVCKFYKKGEYPSIQKVLEVAKQEIRGFTCGRSSMAKIMKDLGFVADKRSAGIMKKMVSMKRKAKKRELDTEDESNDSKTDDDTVEHGSWQKAIDIEDIRGSISIEFGKNTYLSVLDNGLLTIGPPNDEGDGPSPNEIFTAFPIEETKFSLKTKHGKYVGVSEEGIVNAKSNVVGPTEQWEPVWQDGKTAILSSLNTLMSVNPDDGTVVARALTAGDLEFCTIWRNKEKEEYLVKVKEELTEKKSIDEYVEVV